MHHLIAPSSRIEADRPLPLSSEKGDANSSSKREPQPPRYTIFRALKSQFTAPA
jgi:hypothetical protein